MPDFRVTSPDGRAFTITAPDGASMADIQQYAQSQFAQREAVQGREREREGAQYDPTKNDNMADTLKVGPWDTGIKTGAGTEKVLANLGAGFANLGAGVQSLGAKVFGDDADKHASDEAVMEKRALDDQLARGTRGGSALQLAGEVAPTLLIPAGSFASGAARGLGMLPRVGTALARRAAGSSALDAAVAGGVSGALAPTTSDESTLARIALGAGLGGAVPVLGRKVSNTIARLNPWGSGQRAAAEAVGEHLGAGAGDAERAAAAQRVADRIRALPSQAGREAVDDVASGGAQRAGADMGAGGFDPAVEAAQRAGVSLDRGAGRGAQASANIADEAGAAIAQRPHGDIPLSTAAQLGDENLAWLEVGNRARGGANWGRFDAGTDAALAGRLEGATAEGQQIASRIANKNANWNSGMREALSDADADVFSAHVGNIRAEMEDALTSAEAKNPKIRALYRQVLEDLDDPNLTPAHLQQVRANFNADRDPFNPTAYSAAPRDSHAVNHVINRLDEALEDTTGGAWSGVRSRYQADAASVDEAKAAQRLSEKFWGPNGEIRGTSSGMAGDLPTLSEAGFSRATLGRDAEGYSEATKRGIDDIQAALKARNITQRVKKASTAGGGSATAPTQYAARDAGRFGGAVADAIRAIPGGRQAMGALEGIENIANRNRDRAIGEALQDPAAMLRLLERVQQSGQPLTPAQQALIRTLRAGSVGTAEAAQHH